MDNNKIETNICRDCLRGLGGSFSNTKRVFFRDCDYCFREGQNTQHFEFNIAGEPAELQGDDDES